MHPDRRRGLVTFAAASTFAATRWVSGTLRLDQCAELVPVGVRELACAELERLDDLVVTNSPGRTRSCPTRGEVAAYSGCCRVDLRPNVFRPCPHGKGTPYAPAFLPDRGTVLA